MNYICLLFVYISFLFQVLGQNDAINSEKQFNINPSPQEVAAYIIDCEILHPDIVLKQAILETGWFKSNHLMSRNNLFGFRYTKSYMRFDTWQESVEYYSKWQQRKYTNKFEDYYKFLVRIKYAQAPNYIIMLKKINLNDINLEPKNEPIE